MPGDPPASRLPRSDSPARSATGDDHRVQATRIRPDTRPTDIRRLAAAALSALIPGLGQLFNGRRRLAALFLIPSLILLALGALIVGSQSRPAAGRLDHLAPGPGHAPDAQHAGRRMAAGGRRPGVPRHPPERTDRPARDRRPRGDRDPGGPAPPRGLSLRIDPGRHVRSHLHGARSSARPRSAAPTPARSRATASG